MTTENPGLDAAIEACPSEALLALKRLYEALTSFPDEAMIPVVGGIWRDESPTTGPDDFARDVHTIDLVRYQIARLRDQLAPAATRLDLLLGEAATALTEESGGMTRPISDEGMAP